MRSRNPESKPLKKRVYLFELDSVRSTDLEIVEGQRALYREIVENGNVVVLTFNQLVDSRGFLSLLTGPLEADGQSASNNAVEVDTPYYTSLMALFKARAIRISQFGDIRTISQYLLNQIDNNKEFFYSALPLKCTQKRLIALVKRSLIFSDLSEIHGFFEKRSDEKREEEQVRRLQDLFCEVREIKNIDGSKTQAVFKSELNTDEQYRILHNLYVLLKTVIRLSTLDYIYINPRKPEEYSNLKLVDYLHAVAESVNESSSQAYPVEYELFVQAMNVLGKIGESNNRSVYLARLRENSKEDTELDPDVYRYAEAIVNICYNYACEASVRNISKHYNIDEINNGMPNKPTFVEDFCHRLSQDWNQCGLGSVAERYLKEETNKFIQFEGDSKQYLLPDFERAARIAEFGGYMEDARREKRLLASSIEDCPQLDAQHGIHRYEEHLDEQRATNRRNVRGRVWKKILFAFVCLIVACGVEWILDELQEVVTRTGIFSGILPDWAWNIIEMVVFLLVAEFVTDMISRGFPNMMSLSEALDSMFHWFGDLAGVGTRTSTYCTPDEADSVTTKHKPRYYVERCNAARPVDVVIPYALKQYVAFWRKEREQNSPDYMQSGDAGFDEAPDQKESLITPNMADSSTQKELVRLEELFQYQFGLVYSSHFNRWVVDPIVNTAKAQSLPSGEDNANIIEVKTGSPYYSYERVVPSCGDGVVILTKCGDSFILLNQYRHAVKSNELCCPRGYAEPGQSACENAERELKEELGVEPSEPLIPLGVLSPDTGLIDQKVSVFLAQIDAYEMKQGYEGIVNVVQLNEDELRTCIANTRRQIADGETDSRRYSSNANMGTAPSAAEQFVVNDGYTIGAFCLYLIWSSRMIEPGQNVE